MLYAAYGSNLHPLRLRQRVPAAALLGKGVLSGRELRFHKRSVDGSGKCDIVRDGGTIHGEVHVAVYDVPADAKPDLDRAESLGAGYRIETVDVPGFGDCFTYVAMEEYVDPTLRPYRWYLGLVLIGCAYLRFPHAYSTGLGLVPSDADPDPARRAAHTALLRAAHRLERGRTA